MTGATGFLGTELAAKFCRMQDVKVYALVRAENRASRRDTVVALGRVLSGLGLPLSCDADADSIISLIMNDKKVAGDCIDIAQADEIGKAHLETWTMEDIRSALK